MIYYSTFIVVFQFGWASTQISHLAAIPDLSECQNERTGLTAIRFAMTVISTILVRKIKYIYHKKILDSKESFHPKMCLNTESCMYDKNPYGFML